MRLARSCMTACLAASLLALAGCRESHVVREDYLPMRDGNRWEYRLLDLPRLKALAEGREVPTEEEIQSGPREAKEGEEPEAAAAPDTPEQKKEGQPETPPAEPARRVALDIKEAVDELTFRAAYDGFEQVWTKRGGYVGFQDGRGRHYLLILPPHTTYRWIVTDQAGENLYYEVEGHKDLETPAGAFPNCAVSREEARDRRIVFRYWFAPGVGLVRRSKYYLDQEVFRQELVRYEVRASLPATREAEAREVSEAAKGKRRGIEHLRAQEAPKPSGR